MSLGREEEAQRTAAAPDTAVRAAQEVGTRADSTVGWATGRTTAARTESADSYPGVDRAAALARGGGWGDDAESWQADARPESKPAIASPWRKAGIPLPFVVSDTRLFRRI